MPGKLFSSYQLGDLKLNNRMVMAPMTRNRAATGGIVRDITVEYYRQRASAGLIITEAAQVSPEGVGYPATPGIYSAEQVVAWRKVTDAVHTEGGKIFIQLWFCGRISHPDLLPNQQTPVAPSAIKPDGDAFTFDGSKPFITPKALEKQQILHIVSQYRHAAEQARQAGFDGVEIHAANGYLIDQFLCDGSNRRNDEYGGSMQNRMLFLNQILDAVAEVWPSQRIGVRLSPENTFNSISDSAPEIHFRFFIEQLARRKLAYLHLYEGNMNQQKSSLDYPALRSLFGETYIANQGYNKQTAEQALNNKACDLVSFGVPFLANPDLVHRFQIDAKLNTPDPDTFYGGKEKGYTDYPFLSSDKFS
jgi:N-ethylmaleimide reductase